MSQSSRSSVKKLLRVLVAGGVALAGVAGTARADEQPASQGQKEKAEAAREKEQAARKEKEKAEKKAAAEAKAKQAEGGGVQGW
jgi:hypothetical protein